MEYLENLDMAQYVDVVLIDNPGIVFVKITASWCSPCQQIAPFVEDCIRRSRRLGKKNIRYVSIDVDKNPIVYRYLRTAKLIRGVPAFFVYFLDEESGRCSGSFSSRDIMREAVCPDDFVLGANEEQLKRLFAKMDV